MAASLRIYIQGDTLIHRADARMKLVLLLLFSVGVFFVDTWRGLGVYSLVVAAVVAAGRIPLARMGALSLPLAVLLAFIWVCNAFAFDVGSLAESGLGGVSAGFAEGWQPVALAGTFGFVPQGCMFALFYAVRIFLILWASFAVSFTTSAEALTGAFASLMRPLRVIRVPVDDAATMLSLAVRFIPLTAEELALVRNAQTARGAQLESGSVWQRLFAYRTVFIPLVVRLFRRADALSISMVARCYGSARRTSLEEPHIGLRQAVVFGMFGSVGGGRMHSVGVNVALACTGRVECGAHGIIRVFEQNVSKEEITWVPSSMCSVVRSLTPAAIPR